MAKVISFRIRLEGSKDILKEIDRIGKKLRESLSANTASLDSKALDSLKKTSSDLSKGLTGATASVSQMQKRLSELRAEGKANSLEYQNLVKQIGSIRAQQAATTQEIRRAQKETQSQVNLQKLLSGEIKASDLSQKQFFEAINSGLDKADPKYNELINDFARLRAEEKAFRDGLKEQQRAFEATKFAAGSYRELNATLGRLRAEYRDLSEAERKGPAGKESLQRIQQLDKELKRLDSNMGNYQRNVGNYERAWRGAGAALAAVGVGVGLSEVSRAVRDSIKLFGDFEQQIKKVEIAAGQVQKR
jgi:chromosome segregation ATPase